MDRRSNARSAIGVDLCGRVSGFLTDRKRVLDQAHDLLQLLGLEDQETSLVEHLILELIGRP